MASCDNCTIFECCLVAQFVYDQVVCLYCMYIDSCVVIAKFLYPYSVIEFLYDQVVCFYSIHLLMLFSITL